MNRIDPTGRFSLGGLNISQGISAGMRGWSMWSSGQEVHGSISRVIQGASLMQELKGAVFGFAMGKVGGKIGGDLTVAKMILTFTAYPVYYGVW